MIIANLALCASLAIYHLISNSRSGIMVNYTYMFPGPTIIIISGYYCLSLIIPFWYALVEYKESLAGRNGLYLTKIYMARPKKTCYGKFVDRDIPNNDEYTAVGMLFVKVHYFKALRIRKGRDSTSWGVHVWKDTKICHLVIWKGPLFKYMYFKQIIMYKVHVHLLFIRCLMKMTKRFLFGVVYS